MITKSQTWKAIRRGRALAALVLAGVIILNGQTASAQGTPNSAKKQSASATGLVGTWRVTVQLYDCATEALIGPPFASLLTFNEGGTMAGSTTNRGFAIAQRGPDQGIWSRTARGTYSAKSVAFLYFTTPPSPPFNPGFLAGTQELTQSIELDQASNEFKSEATTEFFDVNGNSYRTGCASAVAQRFE
ncbi:MAG: hypothetical protein NVS1B11_37270 [Terriglobales bacterium]